MTLRMVLREALTSARSSPVSTLLVLLVVAAMCFASVVTVGRQAALDEALARELAGPAARTVTVTDTGGTGGISVPDVQVLLGLDGTEAVIARESPIDAVNGALGEGATPVAVVGVRGDLSSAVEVTRGRLPGPGEAIVPEALLPRLRLAEPVGYLAADGTQWPIVGGFRTRAPFEDLDGFALAGAAEGSDGSVQQVRVVATSAQDAAVVQGATLAVLDLDPTRTQVQGASVLSSSNQAVAGQVAEAGRSLLLLILGAGAFFVAVVVLADVLIRRRDLGRRRTLGITRGDLITLVAARTAVPAVFGVLAGCGVGALVVARGGAAVPWTFTAAIGVLALVTAGIASLPPAAFAASRDPVEVMRTP